MPRKYDEFGYNRQFKSNPCNRRDPFPRDHLPFIDDMSVLSEMYGNGLGQYGPKMPQPITSRPIEQTPGSATPVYQPGSKTPGTLNYDIAAKKTPILSFNSKLLFCLFKFYLIDCIKEMLVYQI